MTRRWSVTEIARSLRRKGVPEEEILARFDHKYSSFELTEMIDDMRTKNRAAARAYLKRHGVWHGEMIIERPDPLALAERERRLGLWPVTTTAIICGDPLPGYSALDRR